MKYIAKSQWALPHILDKLERGADGIEIQLLNPDTEECLRLDYKIPEEFKILPIKCIHLPLNAQTDCNYDIETPIGQRAFIKSIILAEKLIDKTGSKMNIVCHMTQDIKTMNELEILDKTYEFIATQAMLHPNCNINIENVTRRTMGIYDNAVFARSLNLPNVGTVIDTCHSMISEFITGQITEYGKTSNEYYKFVTIEDAFKENKDICRWIHLNNANMDDGFYGKGKGHGVPFDINNKEDMEKLTKVLKLYKTLDFKAPLCLEVREDNYLHSENFSKTRRACEEVFKNIGEY